MRIRPTGSALRGAGAPSCRHHADQRRQRAERPRQDHDQAGLPPRLLHLPGDVRRDPGPAVIEIYKALSHSRVRYLRPRTRSGQCPGPGSRWRPLVDRLAASSAVWAQSRAGLILRPCRRSICSECRSARRGVPRPPGRCWPAITRYHPAAVRTGTRRRGPLEFPAGTLAATPHGGRRTIVSGGGRELCACHLALRAPWSPRRSGAARPDRVGDTALREFIVDLLLNPLRAGRPHRQQLTAACGCRSLRDDRMLSLQQRRLVRYVAPRPNRGGYLFELPGGTSGLARRSRRASTSSVPCR